MGCLKKTLNIIILSFAVIGFVSVGGPQWVSQNYEKFVNSNKQFDKKTELGDFSKLDSEFEIDKSMNYFGYKGIIAEHKISGQKFIILETKDAILTEDDIKKQDLEDKILSLVKKQRSNSVVPSEFKIISHGSLSAYGKVVPCARFTAKIKKMPMGNFNGMVAVVESNNKNNKILISANQNNKYSQLVSQQFFGQISE